MRFSVWNGFVGPIYGTRRPPSPTAVADAVVSFARSEAEAAIKSIDLDDVQKLVEAQMKNLTDPLEKEIQTTMSWWVKIRNRLYIVLMKQAVKNIVADVKKKIA